MFDKTKASPLTKDELKKHWKDQEKKRKASNFIPSGHINGKFKPLIVDSKTKTKRVSTKSGTCPRDVKRNLPAMMDRFLIGLGITTKCTPKLKRLTELRCPLFLEGTQSLLTSAHSMIQQILPVEDCEQLDASLLAFEYWQEWKPSNTKVIIMGESHGNTPSDLVSDGPTLMAKLIPEYKGTRRFLRVVTNIGYGEPDAMTGGCGENKGSHQYWRLLAMCAYGYDFVSENGDFKNQILSSGEPNVGKRVRNKLSILNELKKKGIWLLDAAFFGWYLQQDQCYTLSSVSNEIQRAAKDRPPKKLKDVALVLAWEGFTKHIVHQAATQGHLKLLIPLGYEMSDAITMERFEEAIVESPNARVAEPYPAPNAWVQGKGGYDRVLLQLHDLLVKNLG